VASVADLEISQAEMSEAFEGLPAEQRDALRPPRTHPRVPSRAVPAPDAGRLDDFGGGWHRHRPAHQSLDSVGLYVPAQSGLPIVGADELDPAHVAAVERLTMVVPTPGGERNALVLAAAHLGGVSRAFAVGGAQAVAALAYGTATIRAVDKIVGPAMPMSQRRSAAFSARWAST